MLFIVLVFYTVLSIFNFDGDQVELAWLLGISHHIASPALWSYEHVYLISATTTGEGPESHRRMTCCEKSVASGVSQRLDESGEETLEPLDELI